MTIHLRSPHVGCELRSQGERQQEKKDSQKTISAGQLACPATGLKPNCLTDGGQAESHRNKAARSRICPPPKGVQRIWLGASAVAQIGGFEFSGETLTRRQLCTQGCSSDDALWNSPPDVRPKPRTALSPIQLLQEHQRLSSATDRSSGRSVRPTPGNEFASRLAR
jgi:hypothetical protein